MAYPPLGLALIIVSVVFPILALVMIVLRVVARSRADKRVDLSDWFLFFAMVCVGFNPISRYIGTRIDDLPLVHHHRQQRHLHRGSGH